MDDMIKDSLAGFDSLWQRVSCHGDSPAEPECAKTYSLEDTLLGFIHEETCAGTCAAALSRMLPGDGRAVLQRHAADARRHVRRLRAEYFIATGIAGGSNEDCRSVTGKLASLRALFLQAEDLAGRYDRAAEQTDVPELREVFCSFASEERRHAQESRALLIENF